MYVKLTTPGDLWFVQPFSSPVQCFLVDQPYSSTLPGLVHKWVVTSTAGTTEFHGQISPISHRTALVLNVRRASNSKFNPQTVACHP